MIKPKHIDSSEVNRIIETTGGYHEYFLDNESNNSWQINTEMPNMHISNEMLDSALKDKYDLSLVELEELLEKYKPENLL